MGWPPALRELKDLLYEVYLAAAAPSLDEITAGIDDMDDELDGSPRRDTVRRVISDSERPKKQADVVAVATVLARHAAWDAPDLACRVRELWVRARMAQGVGRPIGDLRGRPELGLDGGLGIHPALDTGGARDRFGILPAYVPRDHDAALKAVVEAAAKGRSGIAVLVGGSSTGKTRALWEAVAELPQSWRLWHPLTPTAPEAVLAALPDIAPRTVVWLNEAQNYLTPTPLGEQVAAGLRELLNDPSRAPLVVLGTLWPEHWDTLTTRTEPDRHAGARELLGGHKIDVPDAFTLADLAALDAADDGDPRLAQAAHHAQDAQITQYLAGVPYLMDRYNAARGATRALIHAAMDARRLGAGLRIPLDWLAAAAPGYLTDAEYRGLDGDWLDKALAYVTTPCNGVPGILTPAPARGPRNQRTPARPATSGRPRYLLADYLDQHGRRHRATQIPPVDFWTAAARHAPPADLTALGDAAWNRGLYRDAAQLHKNATAHGNPHATGRLVKNLHRLHPTDSRPAQWALAHAALDDLKAVATVLTALRAVGAHEQITELAELVVARAGFDDPHALSWLLRALRYVAAHEQITALLARNPAAHTPLDNPEHVAKLLGALRQAGADEQITALLARDPAAHTPLDNPHAVAGLLNELRAVGAHEQASELARQAAARTPLDTPYAVFSLLSDLRRAGAHEQFTELAERFTAHVALNYPRGPRAAWLKELRAIGAHEQVTELARQAAARTPLDDPNTVAVLLSELQKVRAHEQITALLARNPAAHTPLDDPRAVAALLYALRKNGAEEQITALLARNPAAHATLDNPISVADLLYELRENGVDEQVTTLLARNPAAHATLDNPHAVAILLSELHKTGTDEQVTALLARDPATHATLDHPMAIERLLGVLREIGAHEQVTALLARDPATHAIFNNSIAVEGLLGVLREVGAHEQITALTGRLATEGHFDAFIEFGGHQDQFPFGREPDGTAAPAWSWSDLD
ncbi:hypothetical protein WN71_035630 [Streptomyces mangrovisoli]|uniref:Uncharacterized protein n=1 Tax=Streptomyces mangrovisoli TaxID=1428628 RepID=A0A1J4NLK7_9ACTN|nr:hypothetical protein WN71_035630 [Streptomyces mangrovisoli]